MKTTVCFTAKNIYYLKGGGHFWVPLNWSLGFRALGCDVIWLEPIDPSTPVEEVWTLTKLLKETQLFELSREGTSQVAVRDKRTTKSGKAT